MSMDIKNRQKHDGLIFLRFDDDAMNNDIEGGLKIINEKLILLNSIK
jgi:hypothetical protein